MPALPLAENVRLSCGLKVKQMAIRLEHLWDEIAKSYDVEVLCGYPLGSVQGVMDSRIFERICAEHSVVHSR